MKPVLMLAAGVAALTLSACDRNGAPLFGPAAAMKPVSRLNCPDNQGDLKRVSASPDGQTCTYSDGDGAEVALQIVKTSGDPHVALKPIEASLSALAKAGETPQGPEPADSDAEAGVSQAAVAASPNTRSAAQAATSEAEDDAEAHPRKRRGGDDENVTVDLPGLHVRAHDDDADVRVFGMQIQADGDKGTAHVTHRPRSGIGRTLEIDGSEDGGLIRTEHLGHANFRTTVMWMQNNDEDSREFGSVGYVAAGPVTGPLVVATVKVKGKEKHGVYERAGRIIRRASRS